MGSITKHGVKVDVATGGNLFAREAIDWFVIWDHGSVQKLVFFIGGLVKDVNRAALVKKDFLNGVVFDFNSDDHGVVLLVVEAVKVIICEHDRGIRRLWWDWVMWLIDCMWRRCLFLADEVEPPLAKPPEMVLIVPRKGGSVGVMLVWAGCEC